MEENKIYGFLIHMAGNYIGKPESTMCVVKGGGLVIRTTFPEKSNKKDLIVYTKEKYKLSIAQLDNGYFYVLVNYPGKIMTAILLDEYGVGRHSCYQNNYTLECVINPDIDKDKFIFKETTDITGLYQIVDDYEIRNNIMSSIRDNIVDMLLDSHYNTGKILKDKELLDWLLSIDYVEKMSSKNVRHKSNRNKIIDSFVRDSI